MAKTNNPVMTRFTTGKARLTYAFLWTPRSSENDDEDIKDEKTKKDEDNENNEKTKKMRNTASVS